MSIVIGPIPIFATGPLTGLLADKFGTEYIATPILTALVAWPILLILKSSLAGFIVYNTFYSQTFWHQIDTIH